MEFNLDSKSFVVFGVEFLDSVGDEEAVEEEEEEEIIEGTEDTEDIGETGIHRGLVAE